MWLRLMKRREQFNFPDGNLFDISVHGYMTEEFAPKRREKTDAKEKLDA